jgi:drug/metabolite transporter (DMT)-like permease
MSRVQLLLVNNERSEEVNLETEGSILPGCTTTFLRNRERGFLFSVWYYEKMGLAIIYGLLSALATGLSLVLIKKSYDELSPSIAFAFQALFGIIIWVPFSLYVGISFNNFLWVLLFALISAVLSEAFYYYIFSKADVGITTISFATYPVFTALSALVLLGERPPVYIWPFVILIIIGIILLSLPDKKIIDISAKYKAIYWGLIGAVTVGVSDTLSKGIIDETSAATFLFALSIMQIPVAIIFLIRQKENLSQFKTILKNYSKYKYALLGAFSGVIAVLFLWLAFEGTYAAVASPITAAFPVFTIILAYFWLKEKISSFNLFSTAVVMIGIFGISLFL